MKNENDMEDLFKKSFDNYEPEVRPKVWENVKVGLKWGSLGMLINALMNKIGTTTIIAVVSSVAAIIGTMVVVNMNNDKKQEIADKTAVTTVITADTNQQTPTTNEINSTDLTATNSQEIKLKNTIVAPNENKEKSETVKGSVIDESVAAISASLLSGKAPLIVDLSNTGTGKTNKWLSSDSKKTINSSNPVYIFETPGTYSIQLTSTSASGKSDVDTVLVEVTGTTPTPKGFSPNGDGVSDVFKFDIQKVISQTSKVFDKNGSVVYKSESAGEWDGTDLSGKEVEAGNYYYMIHAVDANGKNIDARGVINLKR